MSLPTKIEAINHIFLLFYVGVQEGNIDKVIDATELGCLEFKDFLRDEKFEKYVEQINHYKDIFWRGVLYEAINSRERYFSFLEEERGMLVTNGMEPKLVTMLIQEAHQLYENIISFDEDPPDSDFLLDLIRVAGNQCCNIADMLRRRRTLRGGRIIQILWRSMYGLAGAGIITINSMAASNISPLYAFSIALGTVFIDRAVGHVYMPKKY